MKSLATHFLEECGALHLVLEPLSEPELDQATAFKGWTINRVIHHLHVWNLAADMSLNGDGSFSDFYGKLEAHRAAGGTMGSFERAWLGALSGPALVEAWRKGSEEIAGRFANADPSARVKWAGPDMSVRSSLTARLMETWAHGQEVYDVLGIVRENGDRIRNIVVLGNNTYGWTFKVRGEAAPEPRPHLRLTAPSGELWLYNEPSETELVQGLAEEFCQVVTQVRNVADTKLTIVGANARNWMSKAQCFAGDAETPPAAGARKTAVGR